MILRTASGDEIEVRVALPGQDVGACVLSVGNREVPFKAEEVLDFALFAEVVFRETGVQLASLTVAEWDAAWETINREWQGSA